ncbi:MAG: hypothetical protein RLZZ399_2316 [Verrucomicrobiota bacterium]|jgi:hypothetical protein
MNLSRRHFLRGLGIGIGLPFLESLAPLSRSLASTIAQPGFTPEGRPLRTAFLYVPNGVNVKSWTPTAFGSDYELSPTLRPLAPWRDSFQVLAGLEQRLALANGDGAGDHARASATMLTGARPKKTAGSDIRVGISVDQLAARHLGHHTRFDSLELSCNAQRRSGSCDSGYSCAYQFNISWRSESLPVAPESNPRLVFERLFGSGSGIERQKNFQIRQAQQRSILDFVRDDAQALRSVLGSNDQHKLDEYLTGIRELEKRIEKTERFGPLPDPHTQTPAGIPQNYREYIRQMMDLLVLAFQTDSTRIASFLLAHDGSNRNFPEIGISDGHHNLSHHQNKEETLEKIARIDLFYTEQLAYLLQRLHETPDGSSNLLHNSMLVYGSGLSDGNRHAHHNLPILLAGRGGGALQPGQHLRVGESVPMSNLYVRMLEIMGVPVERFGDSTGTLTGV